MIDVSKVEQLAADNLFDRIICISTREHIGNNISTNLINNICSRRGGVKALSEIFRILKTGERDVLTVHYSNGRVEIYEGISRRSNSK